MKTQLSRDFKKVLDYLLDYDGTIGICACINSCPVSANRQHNLREFFRANKPTKTLHIEFYSHFSYTGKVFWWEGTYLTKRMQRIMFLEKMIEISNPPIIWYKRPFVWLKQIM